MEADVDLFIVKQHAVDSLYGVIGSLRSLVVDEAVSLRTALFVCSDLARQDIAKGRKSVMESLLTRVRYAVSASSSTYLVVNELIQVFNEDIALASLAEGRVTLRPHDPARSEVFIGAGSDSKINGLTMHGF
jgi:hypothetical protein